MRRFTLLFAALLPLPAFAQTLVINPAARHQTIEGFGTFLNGESQASMTAWKDLGLNIMRMSLPKEALVASPTDFATRVPLGPDLQSNIAKMNFDFPAIANFGHTAATLQATVPHFKLIADSWSPPHWMKGPTGQSVAYVGNPGAPAYPTPWLSNTHNVHQPIPSNTGDSIGGRLRTEDPTTLAEYGRYMAAYVKGFENRYGVRIDNISLQNEAGFENPFDSMTLLIGPNGQYDPSQYAKALKSVRDAFAADGITTKIRGPHYANLLASPANPYGLNHQMNMIAGVKSDPDPTLKDAMAIYTSNYYMGTDPDSVRNTVAYWKGKSAVNDAPYPAWVNAPGIAQDGKQNWFVETSDGPNVWRNGPNGTPGNGAITVALKLHNALVHADASAYLYWQFIDGPAVPSGTVGQPSEYGLLGRGQENNPTQSKKYDAFGQFSKFIAPGSVRIDANFAQTGTSTFGTSTVYDTLHGLDASAYLNEETGLLTIVLINATASAQTLTLALPEAGIAGFSIYQTSDAANLSYLGELSALSGAPALGLPAYSVTTLTGRTHATVPEPAMAGLLLPVTFLLRRRRGQ